MQVKKAQVMYDPHSRESRGFGFVTMESAEEADAAIAAMNGAELMGKAISVEKVSTVHYFMLVQLPITPRFRRVAAVHGPPLPAATTARRRGMNVSTLAAQVLRAWLTRPVSDERPYDPRPYDSRYSRGGDEPRRRPRYEEDYRGGSGGGRDYERGGGGGGYSRDYERGGGGAGGGGGGGGGYGRDYDRGSRDYDRRY